MKRLASVMISALLLSTLTPVAFAAIKPGNSCSKLGAVVYTSGKKYTCVKSGSRWIWNKGIVASKPAATALESMNKRIYERYLSTANASDVDFFDLKLCPGVNKAKAMETVEAYKRAFKFWSVIFTPKEKMSWLIMSENDYECWKQSVIENSSTPEDLSLWNKETGMMGHCSLGGTAYCGYGQGSRTGKLLQYNVIGSNYTIKPNPEVINHEVVHFYQQLVLAGIQTNFRTESMPCWYREGEANLFGMAIAFKGAPVSFRFQMVSELEGVYPNAKKMGKGDWLATLDQIAGDWNGCLRNNLGYSLGWFILEYIYQNNSFEKVQQVYLDMIRGDDWNTAIKKELGRDWSLINEDIANYLAESI
jgi:hypothetical protein